MNNPKIYLVALLFCSLVLVITLWLKPQFNSETIQATVISQTLTQSLDGHRRYLNVETEHAQNLLVQSDAKIDCPEGSTVTLKQQAGVFSNVVSYAVIKCKQ